jgi:hypothetical protein
MEWRDCPKCNIPQPIVIDRQGYERCRVCAWAFGLDEVRPVVEKSIPQALPVQPTIPQVLPVTPGVADSTARGVAPRAVKLNRHQKKFFDYLANTVEHCRAALTWWSLTRDYVRLPFQLLVIGIILYLAVLTLHEALDWFGQYVGDWINYAMYLVPVFPLLIGCVVRSFMEEQPVDLTGAEPRFSLGRFTTIFDSLTQAIFGCLVLAVFISELAVLSWTPNHAGLEISGDVQESVWLCLQTLQRSFFLDSVWLGWQIGLPVEHGGWSTPLFWFFRLAYNGLALIIVYDLYLKYKYRNFLKGAPLRSAGPVALAEWIETLCKDRQAWPRHFTDEFLFLYLGAKYLRGEYALLRTFGRATRWARINASVREFFVDASGTPLIL